MQHVIAIDPGRDKTGIALVRSDSRCIRMEIIGSQEVETVLQAYMQYSSEEGIIIEAIVCGDGTLSQIYGTLAKAVASQHNVDFYYVNEMNTTAEGRIRYWQCNPPKGLKSILPISWLTPPCPVDDYTAWIIGERYFMGRETI